LTYHDTTPSESPDRPAFNPSKAAAIIALARVLYETMQGLEPWTDTKWDDMTPAKQDFYLTCVEALERHPELLRALAN
jgi:hypothetical protein